MTALQVNQSDTFEKPEKTLSMLLWMVLNSFLLVIVQTRLSIAYVLICVQLLYTQFLFVVIASAEIHPLFNLLALLRDLFLVYLCLKYEKYCISDAESKDK